MFVRVVVGGRFGGVVSNLLQKAGFVLFEEFLGYFDGADTGQVGMMVGLRHHCAHYLNRLLMFGDGEVDELFVLFGGREDEDGLLLRGGTAGGGAL